MTWTVAGVVRDRAASDPDEPIFSCRGTGAPDPGDAGPQTVTAREFDERTSRVGRALLWSGCRPGDRVGFVGRNELAWYELFFGAAKAGVVAVGLNWRLSATELAAVAADAGVRVVVGGPGFDAEVRTLARAGDGETVGVEAAGWSDFRDRHPPDDPGHAAAGSDDALQLYTSGTTSGSKGVVLSHDAIAATLDTARGWRLGSGKVALVNLPLFHFGGTGWPLWALALGARCVIHPEVDPAATVASFDSGVTTCLAVPQILRSLCDVADRTGGGPYASLECIGYGSAPITEAALLRTMRTFDCDLLQTYGMTETCGVVSQLGPDDHDPAGPRRHLLRSAGRPVRGVELAIGDGSTPSGTVGPVRVRAPWLMSGYWNRPVETAAVLSSDGWLTTGDLGFVDSDGYLFLTDRAADMIITGGENVYPAEIESVLARHPGVADVAAFGVPDERWGETVVAAVVRDGVGLREGDLIGFARQHLAHYKCPTRVVFVPDLPRNPTGKVLRRELRSAFAPGSG